MIPKDKCSKRNVEFNRQGQNGLAFFRDTNTPRNHVAEIGLGVNWRDRTIDEDNKISDASPN